MFYFLLLATNWVTHQLTDSALLLFLLGRLVGRFNESLCEDHTAWQLHGSWLTRFRARAAIDLLRSEPQSHRDPITEQDLRKKPYS